MRPTLKELLYSTFLFRRISYCLSDHKTLIPQLAKRVNYKAEHFQNQLGMVISALIHDLDKSLTV